MPRPETGRFTRRLGGGESLFSCPARLENASRVQNLIQLGSLATLLHVYGKPKINCGTAISGGAKKPGNTSGSSQSSIPHGLLPVFNMGYIERGKHQGNPRQAGKLFQQALRFLIRISPRAAGVGRNLLIETQELEWPPTFLRRILKVEPQRPLRVYYKLRHGPERSLHHFGSRAERSEGIPDAL